MNAPFRNRDRQITVYLLEEEMAILEAKKDEAGMTKSEYIRNMILFGAHMSGQYFLKNIQKK